MPAGYGLKRHDRIDSTNEEAKRLAKDHPEPLWVMAHEQTAGRGRRGRVWTSDRGNLFASLLIRPECPGTRAAELSFVAALAVYDALSRQAALAGRLGCKWPNDILIDGKKISGILLESATALRRVLDWVVIGIGINITSFPQDTPYPATSLQAEGVEASAEDVMAHLAAAMAANLTVWRDQGFGTLRETWLARASGLGEKITVRLGGRTLSGIFETLDDTGALILRRADGTVQPVHTGDVFFPPERL